MSRLDAASTHAHVPMRKISAGAFVALALALSSPLAAAAAPLKGHAPKASWSDRHAPHASWTDSSRRHS